MSALEISLLGPLEITVDGKPIEVASNYVRALLCFLVIEKDRPHRREALAEMFWPEKPEGVARNSLKQALSNLRMALGDRDNQTLFLLVSRDEIQFNQSSNNQVDAAEFAALLEAYEGHPHENLAACKICEKKLLRAVNLYRGDFLLDFYLPDNQDFNDWAVLKREVFQRQISEVFGNLALIYEAQGEIAHAVEYSRQLTELEPWNEENHRNLMRLLALNGMRSAALRQYQICCDSLEKELGVEPSNTTQSLYKEIKTWEPGTFTDSKPPQIPTGELKLAPHSEEDTTKNLLPHRKPPRRSLVALVIAGFILGIASIHWFAATRNPSAAIASGPQETTQIPLDAETATITPTPVPTETDRVISALTAITLPSETGVPEPTSTLGSASSANIDLENQLQVLTVLYEHTDGANWENTESWLSDLSPCEWYGVTCRSEKITELELTNNRLSGSLPAEIGQLVYLEKLDLRDNHLSGHIPPEIGNLANLKHLYLSGNPELSGPIPPALGNLSNLEVLELAHWESGGSLLSGEIPPELGNLKQLRYLSISVSLLQGPLPVELCELTNLVDLFLDSNWLDGQIPPEIGNMISLQALFLGGNDFTGPIPPELGNLTMLTHLDLGGSLVSGEVPDELGNLVRLQHLALYDTNLGGPLPSTLLNLNLRELFFFDSDLCEPADEAFQAWLEGIHDLDSSELVCESEKY